MALALTVCWVVDAQEEALVQTIVLIMVIIRTIINLDAVEASF